MSQLAGAHATQQDATAKAAGGLLQRKCACGTHTHGVAECDGCRGEGLKLTHTAVSRKEASAVTPDSPAHPSYGYSFGHDFSRIPLHSDAPVGLQAKLAVSSPGDAYEREADAVAEQVVRLRAPAPNIQRMV